MTIAPRPPAVVIRLELEASPHVYLDVTSEGDRLLAWLREHEELRPIVERAVQLEQVARRT